MSSRVTTTSRHSINSTGSGDSSAHDESSLKSESASSSSIENSSSFDESAEARRSVIVRKLTLRHNTAPDTLAGWHSLMPEHRHYLMRYFIADASLSPQVQAIKLRKLACVSRKYYFDVLQTLNAKGFEAASLCSTRLAVPDFFRFKDGDKNRKHKARLRIAQLVASYGHSYIDLSHNWKSHPNQKGLRAAATVGLFSAGSNKWLRIDLSNYRFSSTRQGNAYPVLSPAEWGKLTQDKEGASLVAMLNKELARIIVRTEAMPAFDLICLDQPLYTVVYPLIRQLAAHCAALPGLRTLNLNCSSLNQGVREGRTGDVGNANRFVKFVDRLATILVNSPSLEFMGIRGNGIGPRRLVAIARALQHNSVLERLDLSRNPLCQLPNADRKIMGGIRALKKSLLMNTKLARLNLSFCGMDDKAADELLQALKKNKVLQFVDLTGNSINEEHAIFKDSRMVDRHRPTQLQNNSTS